MRTRSGQLGLLAGIAVLVVLDGCGGTTGGDGAADLAVARDLLPGGGDGGVVAPTCAAAKGVVSACNKEQSIVRVVVRLGDGMPDATGDVLLVLNHYRLGAGAQGGVGHTIKAKGGVTIGAATSAQIDFDMCEGGEMWSEENCEFWLYGFIDTNGNKGPDVGEPAGHAVLDISCHSDGPACVSLVLDCKDGESCAAFTDPGACACRQPACGSPIATCQ